MASAVLPHAMKQLHASKFALPWLCGVDISTQLSGEEGSGIGPRCIDEHVRGSTKLDVQTPETAQTINQYICMYMYGLGPLLLSVPFSWFTYSRYSVPKTRLRRVNLEKLTHPQGRMIWSPGSLGLHSCGVGYRV